jgi:hypothetical protein
VSRLVAQQPGGDVVECEDAGAPSTAPDSAWLVTHPTLGISPIEHLWNRLDGAYPSRFRRDFVDQQAIANWNESWAEAFDEAGLTFDDMKVGLKAVRTRYDWPPSVSEFIKACRPSMDPLLTYHEATAGLQERIAGRMGSWSHPAVFWAAIAMRGDLLTQTFASMKQRWEHALTQQLDRGEWPVIPEPRLELPAPGKSQTSTDAAKRMLHDLAAGGITKSMKDVSDGLRWARRIAERVAAGDTSVKPYQIREAEEALRYQ